MRGLEFKRNSHRKLQLKSNADDQEITEVKLMVLAIQDDLEIQNFINSLTISNAYYRC